MQFEPVRVQTTSRITHFAKSSFLRNSNDVIMSTLETRHSTRLCVLLYKKTSLGRYTSLKAIILAAWCFAITHDHWSAALRMMFCVTLTHAGVLQVICGMN